MKIEQGYISVEDGNTIQVVLTDDVGTMKSGDVMMHHIFEDVNGFVMTSLTYWRNGQCYYSQGSRQETQGSRQETQGSLK